MWMKAVSVLRGTPLSMQTTRGELGGKTPVMLSENVNGWRCQACNRILFSKPGHVNHRKSHDR